MRRHLHARFTLWVAFALYGSVALAGDVLCVSRAEFDTVDCIAAPSGQPVRIAPSQQMRSAVWITGDQSRIAVLTISPGSERLDVEATGNELRFTIGTRRLARGAASIDYKLTEVRSRRVWSWTLSGRVSTAAVLVPEGEYVLEVTAVNAKPLTSRPVRVIGPGVVAQMGLLELLPRLYIAGRILDEAQTPVAHASITSPSGQPLSVSNGDGTFVVDDVNGELPEAIAIVALGFARHEVQVPDRRTSFHAPDIVLERGAPLAVKVAFDESAAMPDGTSIALYRVGHDRTKQLVQKRIIPADSRMVTFDSVGKGRHIVEVAGPQPLQRLAISLQLPRPAEEKPHEIAISPRNLDGHVYFGSEPLEGATITVFPRHQLWEASALTGEDGKFGGTLWEDGLIGATVVSARMTVPFVDDKVVERREETWDIIIPDNIVSGSVVDALTDRGIPGARVTYESTGARMRSSSFVKADEGGRYRITGVPDGTLTLRASAAGYLSSESRPVAVRPSEQSREQILALEPGTLVKVHVVDDFHSPVVGATLLDPGAAMSRYGTDIKGEVSIPVTGQRRLWVIPREGSFSAVTLQPTDDEPVRVVLPSRTGSLAVSVQTDEDVPVPNIRFIVRYDGEVLPDSLWSNVAVLQGFDWITDANGVARHPRLPPGVYELWPYGSGAEGRSIASSPGAIHPVAKIRLNAGDEQIITVTLRPQK